jgi:hypothetical protein
MCLIVASRLRKGRSQRNAEETKNYIRNSVLLCDLCVKILFDFFPSMRFVLSKAPILFPDGSLKVQYRPA